jgi:hypothetical protein
VQRVRLQSNLDAAPCSSVDGSSSCIINEGESERTMEKPEVSYITLKLMHSCSMGIS